MANIKNAMCVIAGGDFECGFEELAAAYSEGQRDSEALENLKAAFWIPNVAEMEENYTRNAEFLAKYPFLLTKSFAPPKDNSYLLFPIREQTFYCFDQRTQKFALVEADADRETKYFFQDLTKPLFVENERNIFNLRFLRDNVRRSEDYAGDNHIYLHYEDRDSFSLLLYYADLPELCKDEKFVFLIGRERELYPLDFKTRFGIDYSAMAPRKLRIEEMQRICFWYKRGYSGSSLGLEVLNCNSHVVELEGLELFYQSFVKGYKLLQTNLPEKILKDTSRKYTIAKLEALYHSPDFQWGVSDMADFIQYLKNTRLDPFTVPELFRAYFIYKYHRDKPHMNPRIVPVILWEPHLNMVDIHDPLVLGFPYKVVLNSFRDPVQTIGRIYQREGSIFITQVMCIGCSMHPELRKHYYAYRFEDLKLHPAGMCRELCELLNVPYDPNMLNADAEDKGINGEPPVHGFDLAPLHRNVDSVFSSFDQVRLQIFYDSILRHFSYPTFDFDECPMDDNDVAFLFKFPFKCEREYVEKGKWGKITREQLRQSLFQSMVAVWKMGKQGELVFPKVIYPKHDDDDIPQEER